MQLRFLCARQWSQKLLDMHAVISEKILICLMLFFSDDKMPARVGHSIQENKDGSITFSYKPKERGTHEMNLTYNDKQAEGRYFALMRKFWHHLFVLKENKLLHLETKRPLFLVFYRKFSFLVNKTEQFLVASNNMQPGLDLPQEQGQLFQVARSFWSEEIFNEIVNFV